MDFTELKRACSSEEQLVRFAVKLVPTPLRHIREIVDNQKYFIALQVRAIQSISWRKRKDLCEYLLDGVQIKGVPDVLYDYKDILLAIDREAFKRYLEEESLDAQR